MRQKTDYEYAQDLKEFIKGYNVRAIYIDPAAASFKLEMIKQGVTKVYDADNEVLDGIRFMSNLIYCGDLKFNRMCKNIIHELSAYCWDENYKARGVDKPKKENDHILDSLRYSCYTHLKGRPLVPRETKPDIHREIEKNVYGYQADLPKFFRDDNPNINHQNNFFPMR